MGLGFLDFSPGDIPTAAQFDGYLMRQTVMTFASEAARNSALSGVLDEGMVAYQEDSDTLSYYDGSNWFVFAGKVGCTVTQSGQSYGTGVTATLAFNGELEDMGGFHSGTSTDMVVPTGRNGNYAITVQVDPGTTVSATSNFAILAEGSEIAFGYIPAGFQKGSASVALPLAATDVVNVSLFNGHSGTLSYSATLRMYLIGSE